MRASHHDASIRVEILLGKIKKRRCREADINNIVLSLAQSLNESLLKLGGMKADHHGPSRPLVNVASCFQKLVKGCDQQLSRYPMLEIFRGREEKVVSSLLLLFLLSGYILAYTIDNQIKKWRVI